MYDFPVCVPGAHSMQKLRWELGKNYSGPVIKMTTPEGKVKEVRVQKLSGGIHEAEIPFRGKGKYTVEILANGPYGVEVAHLIPVYAGIQKENEPGQRKYFSREKDIGSLEKAMVELLNRDRAEYGLKPLQFNSRLCESARIHSRNMAEKGEVAHDLPGCRSLTGRLKDARLKVLKQGENVACDVSIEEAHESLMGSPGHRQAILDPGFKDVGVGIVKQDDLLYVTQNFASFIPEISTSEGKKILLRKINQIRTTPLKENHTLSAAALKHSEKMAASGSLLDTGSLKNAIDSSGIKFRKVSLIVISGSTIEQIAGELEKNKDRRSVSMTEIGIGLRQSNDGSLWVTIIMKN